MHNAWPSFGLSALLITANVLLPGVSAIPAAVPAAAPATVLEVKRDLSSEHAKPMIEQVDKVRDILAAVPDSEVDKSIAWNNIESELKAALKEKEKGLVKIVPGFVRRLRVLFIEFCGTKGDVGKGEYYYSAVEESSVCTRSEQFLEAFKKTKDKSLYHLRFAIDCEAVNFLSDDFKKEHKADIESCGEKREDTRDRVLNLIRSHRPDIIIRGNAVERLYFKDEKKDAMAFWTDITNAINSRVFFDVSAVFDIKSYAKLPDEMKRDYEYQLTPKRQTMVGQTPDWYSDFALLEDEGEGDQKKFAMRQVMIGRAGTPGGNKAVSDHLKKWMKDGEKKIAYFGSGGNKRKAEANIEDVLPVYAKLVDNLLNNDKYKEKYKDWKFIVMHYAEKKDSNMNGKSPDELITDDKRVYHLWYGEPLMEIWKMEQVKVISHHCGKGSFDDVILVNGEGDNPEENYKAMLCIDQLDFGKDMKFWKARLEHFEIGKGAPAIGFKDSKKEEKDYMGIPADYRDENHQAVVEAFDVVASNYDEMGKKSLDFKPVLQADTPVDLFLRTVNYVGLALIRRRNKNKPLGDAPMPVLQNKPEPAPPTPKPDEIDPEDPAQDIPQGNTEEECGSSSEDEHGLGARRKRGEGGACGMKNPPPDTTTNPPANPPEGTANPSTDPPPNPMTTEDPGQFVEPEPLAPPGSPFTLDLFDIPGLSGDRRVRRDSVWEDPEVFKELEDEE